MRWLWLGLLLGLTGCVPYEFDITAPPEAVGHVARKVDTVRDIPPIEYRFQAVEGRLVVRAYNSGDEPLRLLGGQSTVVDPSGQSRRLDDQTIAAHSYMKLIFPPLRPVVEREGPSIGIGFGAIYGDRRGYGAGAGYDDGPSYLRVVDDADYWDWRGESAIRIALTYQLGTQTLTHNFAVNRVKVK